MERYAGISKDKLAAGPMVIPGTMDSGKEYISFTAMLDALDKYLYSGVSRGFLWRYNERRGRGYRIGYNMALPREYRHRGPGQENLNIVHIHYDIGQHQIYLGASFWTTDEDEAIQTTRDIAREIGLDQLDLRGGGPQISGFGEEHTFAVGYPDSDLQIGLGYRLDKKYVVVIPSDLWVFVPEAVKVDFSSQITPSESSSRLVSHKIRD